MPRVLDSSVSPTRVGTIKPTDFEAALDMLQVKGYQGEMVEKVLMTAIVAIGKHLDRGGSWVTPDDEDAKPKRGAR